MRVHSYGVLTRRPYRPPSPAPAHSGLPRHRHRTGSIRRRNPTLGPKRSGTLRPSAAVHGGCDQAETALFHDEAVEVSASRINSRPQFTRSSYMKPVCRLRAWRAGRTPQWSITPGQSSDLHLPRRAGPRSVEAVRRSGRLDATGFGTGRNPRGVGVGVGAANVRLGHSLTGALPPTDFVDRSTQRQVQLSQRLRQGTRRPRRRSGRRGTHRRGLGGPGSRLPPAASEAASSGPTRPAEA